MLTQSLIIELEEKLEEAKTAGGQFMVGLSWKDAEGESHHYFLQHSFPKEDIEAAWDAIKKLTETAV